jgi:D-glycero-alpha-D-manno-heptose-7-phosphate kinase
VIISQTPLRVSFFGGGTDFKDFYQKNGGAVLSATIDKFVYIIVTPRYDDDIVLNYSDRERVQEVDQIKHNIFREALKLAKINEGIEITSIADIPSEGSGLGSSSSFTVGLLNALFAYQGDFKNPLELAELACTLEIDILGAPIGKQDQYAAAFGGFKEYYFNKDGTVTAKNINLSNRDHNALNGNSIMFYTGITRKAAMILQDQKEKIDTNTCTLDALKELAVTGENYLVNLDVKMLGELLDVNWEAKKQLSNKIHNPEIDHIYSLAKQAGVYGGKLLGAGGGGFFLFLCPPENQQRLKESLKDYKELPFAFERFGSRIILNINSDYGFISHKI